MSGVLSGKTIHNIITGKQHSSVVTSDYMFYYWGNNEAHIFPGYPQSTPVLLIDESISSTITKLSYGEGFYVIQRTNSILYSAGYNGYGQIGDGSTNVAIDPVTVDMSGVLKNKIVTQMSSGSSHTIVLTSDNMLFAWGNNGDGQIGDNTSVNKYTPVAVDMSGQLKDRIVTQLASGNNHNIILTSDGKLFGWYVQKYILLI
jgi:alpha-tubulin suppressor-like RCC1 family protein